MAADQQFCLRWNNHQSTLISVFDTLLASEQLVDCTLAAEGQYLKAHKVVLSACSPYLELLLAQHYEKHPIVILKDVKFQELKSMMDYMYRGEVNISQDQLATFLKAAESLQIKGLTDSGEDSRDVGSTKRVDGSAQGARKPVTAAAGAAVAGSASARASPAVQGGSGLTIEPRQPASSPHRSRDGSMSPTPRKRRRARRPSQGDAPDSHNDTSNSCDLPPQSAAPLAIAAPDHVETDQLLNNSRLQNSETVLIKEKVEPTSELMIEPKTEYMDENNEDSVEDLTLDDDDDLDMSGRSGMDMGRPGPSHGDSNQGFASWHMQGDRSGTDEVFMAAQEAVGAHRDSQGGGLRGGRKIDEFLEYLALEPRDTRNNQRAPGVHKRKLRKRKQLIASSATQSTQPNMTENKAENDTKVVDKVKTGENQKVESRKVHKIQHQIKFKATANKNKLAVKIKKKIMKSYKLQANKKVGKEKSVKKSNETNRATNEAKENIGVKVVAASALKSKIEKAKLKAAVKKSTPLDKKDAKNKMTGGMSNSMNTSNGKIYGCDNCDKTYSRKSSLYRHTTYECGKEHSFHCPHCSYGAYQKVHVHRHMSIIHNKSPI